MITPKIKKGDKVVMHTCMEAPYHHGVIWTCQTDEFQANGRNYGLVFLEGFSGYFATEYLQYVQAEQCEHDFKHIAANEVIVSDYEMCIKCYKVRW